MTHYNTIAEIRAEIEENEKMLRYINAEEQETGADLSEPRLFYTGQNTKLKNRLFALEVSYA